ncbi:MAG: hypothetical protein ACI87W_000200 [Halieaceae bacterium]|jgi:hypothetical protein
MSFLALVMALSMHQVVRGDRTAAPPLAAGLGRVGDRAHSDARPPGAGHLAAGPVARLLASFPWLFEYDGQVGVGL